jgi:hypothetical protein
VPKPIKLQEQLRQLLDLKRPLSEEAGKQLSAWAKGGSQHSQDDGVGTAVGAAEDAQQASDGPGPFTETSAAMDYEAAMEERTGDALTATWEEITRDGRLSGPTRAKLYKKYQAKAKAGKGK